MATLWSSRGWHRFSSTPGERYSRWCWLISKPAGRSRCRRIANRRCPTDKWLHHIYWLPKCWCKPHRRAKCRNAPRVWWLVSYHKPISPCGSHYRDASRRCSSKCRNFSIRCSRWRHWIREYRRDRNSRQTPSRPHHSWQRFRGTHW